MPVFMIERNFAEKLEMTPEAADAVNRINDEESVRWIVSFLSADKKKTFCLYEADSAELIRDAADKAGIPADSIVEVDGEILPTGQTLPINDQRY